MCSVINFLNLKLGFKTKNGRMKHLKLKWNNELMISLNNICHPVTLSNDFFCYISVYDCYIFERLYFVYVMQIGQLPLATAKSVCWLSFVLLYYYDNL